MLVAIERYKESVSIARLSSKKGASRTDVKKESIFVKISFAKIASVLVVIFVAGLIYGSLTTVKTVLNVPVDKVDVVGSFKYIKKNEINKIIEKYTVNGFVSVDLNSLRDELIELPWVYKASVERTMQNGLSIKILEQKPLAYWNDDGMINEQKTLFFPKELPVDETLPHLYGKFHRSVLQMYDFLCLELPLEQLPLHKVIVSDSNVIKIRLTTDTWLIMNASELSEKVKMWKYISASQLHDQLSNIEYVDLRYSNGAAVKWKSSYSEVGVAGARNGK